MEKLIIKESEWGHGDDGGKLCRLDNGKKCCLGFWAEQIGNEPLFWAERQPKCYPDAFPEAPYKGSFPCGSRLEGALAEINDSQLPTEEKKRLIAEGFAQIDIEVEFVP